MFTILEKLFIKNRQNLSQSQVRERYGTLAGALGICLNVVLFLGKYLAGIISGSIAVTADALNNLSDAGSSIISLLGFKLAGKEPDPDHPFGHGRVEYLSGLAIALIIMLMGLELAKASVLKIMEPEPVTASALSIAILVASVTVKLYMAYYNYSIGKKIQSAAMKATAVDSLSDSVSTLVVLVSILVAKVSGVNVDGWCGLLVAAMVLWAGYGAAKDTMAPLLGQPPEKEFVNSIKEIVMSYDEVVGIHDLVVHDYGPGRVMISLHAEVPGDGDIYALHDAIDCAEKKLQEELGCEAVIHMDPVAVDDERVRELKKNVERIVKEMDEQMSIHDFRMVEGPTHINLVFDVLVPTGYKMSEKEIKEELQQRITRWNPNYFIVIQVDRAYC